MGHSARTTQEYSMLHIYINDIANKIQQLLKCLKCEKFVALICFYSICVESNYNRAKYIHIRGNRHREQFRLDLSGN